MPHTKRMLNKQWFGPRTEIMEQLLFVHDLIPTAQPLSARLPAHPNGGQF